MTVLIKIAYSASGKLPNPSQPGATPLQLGQVIAQFGSLLVWSGSAWINCTKTGGTGPAGSGLPGPTGPTGPVGPNGPTTAGPTGPTGA